MLMAIDEERLQIVIDVSATLAKFQGEAPLVRDFEKRVARAIELTEDDLEMGEGEKREILDAIKKGEKLPYSNMDVCGAWLTQIFGNSVIFCDTLIGAAGGMLSSFGHKDANAAILVECRAKLVSLQSKALDAFREIAFHWPWVRRDKIEAARDYFDAGGSGVPLEATIDGLQD